MPLYKSYAHMLYSDGASLFVDDVSLKWKTHGGGSIGASGANSPNYVYAKSGVAVSAGTVQASGNILSTGGSLQAVGGRATVHYGGYNGGFGTTAGINVTTTDVPAIFVNSVRSDAASQIVNSHNWYRNAAYLTNPTTMRDVLVSWSKDASNKVEMINGYYDGSFELAAGNNTETNEGGLAHGAGIKFGNVQELLSIAAAASQASAIQVPAGAFVLGVSYYVVTQPSGTTSFDLGITGDTQRFGATISSAATTSGKSIGDAHDEYAAATTLLVTPNTTPSAADGEIRLVIHYALITAPTS